ncbi:PTS sugar transporter subunit IIA [Metabacillus bambusae]|uniref:PTS glucose transporter subunit IIA n=1 Tax=Metabacillus bambusae TaxID=2795218 RepID=A0ABS3N689_9BACI|nr:PTS glucose transporter subunit IIA [Metabacillus bambusae]MBO1513810.1 PTS glucose transporter subunit IIA [Metabacillus bambusae]
MLKSLFGKKEKVTNESIFAPLTGKLLDIEEVPDPVFSQKLMGEGMAIEPTEGVIVAPIDGQVIQVFHTKHAIGLRSQTGLELLIHIGLETVSMNGDGFDVHVKEGQKVKVGDPLITADLSLIREKAASTITPIVITNSDILENITKVSSGNVTKGTSNILDVKVK